MGLLFVKHSLIIAFLKQKERKVKFNVNKTKINYNECKKVWVLI